MNSLYFYRTFAKKYTIIYKTGIKSRTLRRDISSTLDKSDRSLQPSRLRWKGQEDWAMRQMIRLDRAHYQQARSNASLCPAAGARVIRRNIGSRWNCIEWKREEGRGLCAKQPHSSQRFESKVVFGPVANRLTKWFWCNLVQSNWFGLPMC